MLETEFHGSFLHARITLGLPGTGIRIGLVPCGLPRSLQRLVFRILRRNDLEALPLNIILLFGGAMSLGYCLVQTGAADWMAISSSASW